MKNRESRGLVGSRPDCTGSAPMGQSSVAAIFSSIVISADYRGEDNLSSGTSASSPTLRPVDISTSSDLIGPPGANGHMQFCSGRVRGNPLPDRNHLLLERWQLCSI